MKTKFIGTLLFICAFSNIASAYKIIKTDVLAEVDSVVCYDDMSAVDKPIIQDVLQSHITSDAFLVKINNQGRTFNMVVGKAYVESYEVQYSLNERAIRTDRLYLVDASNSKTQISIATDFGYSPLTVSIQDIIRSNKVTAVPASIHINGRRLSTFDLACNVSFKTK